MGKMSTDTLVRPETTPETSTEDGTPKFFHFVKKSRIAESAVLGTYVQALCGETFPVTQTPKPDSPVCPKCKELYEFLQRD